jgi:hypothetical protein
MLNLLSTLASIDFGLIGVLAITCMLLDVCCASIRAYPVKADTHYM